MAPKGNLTGANPADYTTTISYNAFGDPLTVTDPLMRRTSRVYDANRNVTDDTDANQQTTHYVYDAEDQLTRVDRSGAGSLATTYYDDGSIRTQTDGTTNVAMSYTYNGLGQVATSTDSNGTVNYGYDHIGNLTTYTAAGRTTTRTFNAVSQLKSVTFGDGLTPNVTDIGYDELGRRISTTQSNAVNSSWAYDSLNRLVTSSDASSGTASYGYDLAGNLTSIAYPGSGRTVIRTYDDAGRYTDSTDWLGNTTHFGYDQNSTPTTTDFPGAQIDTYTSNRDGQLTGVSMNNGASTLGAVTYGRDNAGRVNSISTTSLLGPSSETYGYNGIGQLTTKNSTSTWTYDAAENLTRTTGGRTQLYNANNQICASAPTIGGTCAAPPTGALTYSYNSRGDRTGDAGIGDLQISYGTSGYQRVAGDWDNNGTDTIGVYGDGSFYYLRNSNTAGSPDSTINYGTTGYKAVVGDWNNKGYDSIGVYTNGIWYLRNTNTAGSPDITVNAFGNASYTPLVGDWNGDGIDTIGAWDPVNHSFYLRDSNTPGAATYNINYGTSSYKPVVGDWNGDGKDTIGVYDPATNQYYLRNTNGPGAADLVIAATGAAGTVAVAGDFDGNGKDSAGNFNDPNGQFNLHEAKRQNGYAYDQAGRLCWSAPIDIANTSRACNSAPAGTNTVTYGYNADGLRTTKTTNTGTTNFTWNHAQGLESVLAETTGTNSTYYLYDPNGLPYAQINNAGTITYLHHDQLGSTRLATNTTGGITGTATYDPYGKPTTTGTIPNLGYAGQYTDPETGYQYLHARYYDPATGQFLTRDPLTTLTGQPYGYANNNPLNGFDPSGLFCIGPVCLSDVAKAAAIGFGVLGAAACGTSIICAVAVGSAAGALSYIAGVAGTDNFSWGEFALSVVAGAAFAGSGAYYSRLTAELGAFTAAAEEGIVAAGEAEGAGANWASRVADNGKGVVWQEPGAVGNANSLRIMESTSQYPNGYVRFYNQYGQPIGLDGLPGPNSATHIPLNPDGTYPLPKNWGAG